MECFSVAVGNIDIYNAASRKAVMFIKTLDGFIGITPVPPRGTLILFKSENDAKIGRNRMNSMGIQTGKNICRFSIR